MASFAVGLNAWANYRLPPPFPKDGDGEQAFSTSLPFSNAQVTNIIDLTSDDRAYDFSVVSMFVDNSSPNSVPLTFVFQGTGQKIVVKANTQGYYPVMSSARNESGSNLVAQVSAPTAGPTPFQVGVIFINYMVEAAVWPTV